MKKFIILFSMVILTISGCKKITIFIEDAFSGSESTRADVTESGEDKTENEEEASCH
jgi:uncharacterized protein YceK